MDAKKKLLEHFTGEKHGVLKVNAGRLKVKVDFGRIVVPSAEGLEEFGKIRQCGIGEVEITPAVVREIIDRDGALCSACEEHRKELAKWLAENFPKLLAKLRKNLVSSR